MRFLKLFSMGWKLKKLNHFTWNFLITPRIYLSSLEIDKYILLKTCYTS